MTRSEDNLEDSSIDAFRLAGSMEPLVNPDEPERALGATQAVQNTRATAKCEDSGAAPRQAFRTFLRIAERWVLSTDEQCALLDVNPDVLDAWRTRSPGPIGHSQVERISYVLGIYKALEILIPDVAFRDRWIRQPNTNPLFGGRAPIDRMLTGDLRLVRTYLDGELEA